MTEFTAAALDVLRTLDKKGAYQIPDTPDIQPLWEVRYIMGDKFKANITGLGQRFIRDYDKGQRH